jgi:hypothetical protein
MNLILNSHLSPLQALTRGRSSNSNARYIARQIKIVKAMNRLADRKLSGFAPVAQCD